MRKHKGKEIFKPQSIFINMPEIMNDNYPELTNKVREMLTDWVNGDMQDSYTYLGKSILESSKLKELKVLSLKEPERTPLVDYLDDRFIIKADNCKLIPPLPDSLHEWWDDACKTKNNFNLMPCGYGKSFLDLPRQSMKVKPRESQLTIDIETDNIILTNDFEQPLSKFVQLYGNILFDNKETDEEKNKKLNKFYDNLEDFMDKVK